MCGKELDLWDEEQDCSIYKYCGYGSENDGDKLELDLCIGCMDKLIRTCKISPVIDMDELSERKKRKL